MSNKLSRSLCHTFFRRQRNCDLCLPLYRNSSIPFSSPSSLLPAPSLQFPRIFGLLCNNWISVHCDLRHLERHRFPIFHSFGSNLYTLYTSCASVFHDDRNIFPTHSATKIVLKGDSAPLLMEMENNAKRLRLPCYLVIDAGRTQVFPNFPICSLHSHHIYI